MYIFLSFDTKKGELTNIAFEYDAMTAYYYLPTSTWARIEKAMRKQLRIDRRIVESVNSTQYYKVVLTPELFPQIGESKIKKVVVIAGHSLPLQLWNHVF